MSCSEFDLKGYFLEELPGEERAQVEAHLPACQECREELARLRLTDAAMMTLRDEEIPQRIAFVSDKVFEPAWWQRLWQSAPRLGFASAAMLAAAIFVHAFTRPAPVIAPSGVETAEVERMIEREVARRLDTAVAEAVAAAETRNEERTAGLLQAAAEQFEMQRQADLLTVQESFDYLRKQMNVSYMASAYQEASQ